MSYYQLFVYLISQEYFCFCFLFKFICIEFKQLNPFCLGSTFFYSNSRNFPKYLFITVRFYINSWIFSFFLLFIRVAGNPTKYSLKIFHLEIFIQFRHSFYFLNSIKQLWLCHKINVIKLIKKTELQNVELPDSFSKDLKNLLEGLLIRDVDKRLGCKGRG